MKQPKQIDTKAIFGPCRLCYVSLLERKKFDGDTGDGKYQCNILIPKNETETINAIKAAIKAATDKGVAGKWGGKMPRKLAESPLRDGDEKEDPTFHGHWYINAKSNQRPAVIDRNREPITDPEDIYSGVWAMCSVSFFPYGTGGNNGIGAGLNTIMKHKDGDRIGGGDSTHDFDGYDDDDDDL
jgi:hypothetical protein